LTDARAAPVRDQVFSATAEKTTHPIDIARLLGWTRSAQYLKHHRTVASGMAGFGVQPHVIEAVLNHRSGVIRDVAATYNRYSYAAEKRAALRPLDGARGRAHGSL
jgi:hypothetical protein